GGSGHGDSENGPPLLDQHLNSLESIRRLLPQCKHAFYINCVISGLKNIQAALFAGARAITRVDSDIELFVQREEIHQRSSRFSIGSSFSKIGKVNKEEESLIKKEAEGSCNDQKIFNKLKHKIIVSDVVLKNRWSSASYSDLMFLNSEMLYDSSSNRFLSLDLKNEESTTNRAIEDEQVLKMKEEIEIKRLFESK
ncbi:hypothetical protein H0E87_012476, partial [Populus deltoides]